MKSYGQFCPVAKAAELFCERWTGLILRDLVAGASRFSELKNGVPFSSPTLLSRRLKQLEATRGHARRMNRIEAINSDELRMLRTHAGIIESVAPWNDVRESRI